jgi:hypothetical protein
MSFAFLAVHHPKPECRQDLLDGMLGMRAVLAEAGGFVDAGPWVEVGGGRIVGISFWDSRAAFRAAAPPGFGAPSAEVHDWETRPREQFHLERYRP